MKPLPFKSSKATKAQKATTAASSKGKDTVSSKGAGASDNGKASSAPA
eukprot:CAMPEP_0119490406 /NCGR_PEP_ID=MMETSP1344-20130328/15584_1 /TAXON_ID=236787 /ORGANISM="Florenciella parvula, Strain CCMP2471" /LENGTH=47 /DNA_ID= /DNA_START= /DNA_END= /DNA_ORIENTATION=